MDETFEAMSQIAAKYDHLEGVVTPETLQGETDEILNLGFKPIQQDEELSEIMLTMMAALELFKAYVPRCVAIGRINDDEKSFETRYFIPRQYQLDHSARIKQAVNSTTAIVKHIAPKSEFTITYDAESICIIFTGV